ncbi:hypothetical protein MtrunA17_Chr2g0276921 [Medicago truncatula]|uniref:Uncharacterized protein n=1 Tax=Medicago truncatula TaxID=3880 RepID=A0A396J238_MEDTR|nr:hypothetical protein MtrunA17_Chr2g0276921 [Medicago truncatula]
MMITRIKEGIPSRFLFSKFGSNSLLGGYFGKVDGSQGSGFDVKN